MLRPKKVPKEDKPFTRRSRPTPQASRLLLTSSLAGVLLIVILAIVFIPRGLDWEGRQAPRVTLVFSDNPEWQVNVTAVSKEAALSSFAVEVRRGDLAINPTPIPSLGPEVTFVDGDADGQLSSGDSFRLAVSPNGAYTFVLHHLPSESVIAFLLFP